MAYETTKTATVQLNPDAETNMSCRIGTYTTSVEKLLKVLGPPHYEGEEEDKVHCEWVFSTPHGTATIYSYWWNEAMEWSIGGHDNLAGEALIAHLVGIGA